VLTQPKWHSETDFGSSSAQPNNETLFLNQKKVGKQSNGRFDTDSLRPFGQQ
jgi:hypothetical protein